MNRETLAIIVLILGVACDCSGFGFAHAGAGSCRFCSFGFRSGQSAQPRRFYTVPDSDKPERFALNLATRPGKQWEFKTRRERKFPRSRRDCFSRAGRCKEFARAQLLSPRQQQRYIRPLSRFRCE